MEPKNPLVSVVLVNFRGADDTIEAIRHLGELDWPNDRLEIVVVENASGDDSAERIAAAAPHAVLVKSKKNLGFAGGCNLGVKKSKGDIIAFLNNDAKPDAGWVREAVRRFEESPRIGAVASRVLDWEGEKVDFIGSGLTWFGMGYKPHTGLAIPDQADEPHDVLFGTGSAMFVRRDVYEELGGFDERYFMFFEDVDLGWRLNLKGYRYAYEPGSLAYHKHHASMSKLGAYKETYLLERNALYTLYKNLGSEKFDETLAATLLLSVRRSVARGELDSTSYDIRKASSDAELTEAIPKDTIATLYAIDQFVQNLPSLTESRREIQESRTTAEHVVRRRFLETNAPSFTGAHFLHGYQNIIDNFDVLDGPARTNVLIITGDPIGAKMAGPAIRAWHMAEALAPQSDVRLVSLEGHEDLAADFVLDTVKPGDNKAMAQHEDWADVIIFQGLAMALFPSIRKTQKVLVVDIYDPMHLEQLEQGRPQGEEAWTRATADATTVLNEQLARGDYFLCASERQRHFYLGQLAALGRINPANYADDPDLTGLISVVPFGLEAEPPAHEKKVLKGVHPGIGEDDKLLLWSGGLYNWFDPLALIRAVAKVVETHPEVKLYFLGTKHPHPGVPEMKIVTDSRALAAELGVADTNVFFNGSWVEYKDRGNYLAEADLGVSTHHSHIETTFSFRTRILDYLWAELPMVVTEGDHFAELVDDRGLGRAVPAGDVDALAAAIEDLLFGKGKLAAAQKAIGKVRSEYEWGNVLAPLVEFVGNAHYAADRMRRGEVRVDAAGAKRQKRRRPAGQNGIVEDVRRASLLLVRQGPGAVVRKVKQRLGL
ncbi:glycosyltransferase [Leucobacter ruminantium]|uniref:Glycosyltransferase n=1 Tax=Leucobacter ruminantium TaxID=1289170 RepID=A0A939LYN6_9MICO|nr:glycosyltransferase [Leucobacter ruminantium]MBO1805548.1 glycosyltransferase [Leucobacter ruminantium]